MITLGHNYTSGWAIHVRSTNGSSVNFWSGIGVIEEKKDQFTLTILSTNQYEKVKEKVKKIKNNIFNTRFKNLSQVIMIT